MKSTTAAIAATAALTVLLSTGCATPDTWSAPPVAPRGARDEPKLQLPPQKDLELFVEDAAGNIRGSLSSDIAFATASSELLPDTTPILDAAVEQVNSLYADRMICIEGFADGVGDSATNLELSQQRAEAVRDELTARGLTNRLVAIGYGEEYAPDGVPSTKWRRVDLTIDKCMKSDGGQG